MLLNELLAQKRMTQYRLWKESGVPQATISDICTGKAKLEKCSAETVYRIAKALDVSMEQLIVSELEARERPAFEVFKSNACHLLKDLGDLPFLVRLLREDRVRQLYEKKWYPEALYLLAMADYLSRLNHIPLCANYNDLRGMKLRQPIYPAEVTILCQVTGSEEPKQACLASAIPEFLRFNIIESEVRNVC